MLQNEESRSGLEFEPFQVSKLVISKVCGDGKQDLMGINFEMKACYICSASD